MIEQVREQMPSVSVRTLCRWLSVNRRWYYQRRKQVKQEERETSLRKAMEEIILSFAGYGYRRVTHALVRAGWKVNHKRVLRQTARTILVVSSQAANGAYHRLAASVSALS